ncbi:ABC transporter ATP-binding protein [Chachezhania antarctica]|uniref:ABC transporter ATP-binding protein n=1 Tax=Chachezhania antarctica TaxID=2340860 RepID=UPI000EACB5DA|nr:ABC transporter ATP-binding protein [Chachezhania antarctica]|tara:strand:+ start:540 stop:1616 length:1077 start_codon:yes stop_codon:yes gene_type:complete
MADPFLRIDNVTRQWDGAGGVSDVSLSVPQGGFVAVLGPSGCGKSTLLRLLAGLETPESGRIEIDGRDVTHLAPAERNLSMVFQSYALFPHLDVAENILFGMKVRRVSRAERNASLARALEMTGLQGLERRKPGALSGGQRQRVALARAVVSERPLCLMDEPLSNLDARLRHSVRRDIKALQTRLGLTVVYVTHDQSEAMSLADTIVLMRDGKAEQVGSPEDLYHHPATPFVARFVGEPPMALIDAEALGEAPGRIGIRIEAIERDDANPDLTAEIVETEYLGGRTQVLFDLPSAEGLALLLDGHVTLPPGSRIGLRLPHEHRVRFAADATPDREGAKAAPRDGHKAPDTFTVTTSKD